ncbi:MAG TPA: ThuA domain-containing protein [Bryobacteraceae bacterium]|nr:ThuA domain-containing protein [Bryobacteraceae bacterium]
MRSLTFSLILLLGLTAVLSPQPPKRKKLLAIGATKGFQHSSMSHALATIERLGQESGIYDTHIRTDIEPLTKQKLTAGNAKNLDFYDAVVFYTTGELDMTEQQKKDLLAFIHDDGKGFIGIHSAIDTFYQWPEYGEMIGGWFKEHPWGVFDAPVTVDDPKFPGMQGFPHAFVFKDEMYQVKNFSPEKVHVIARLDASKLDLSNPKVMPEHRADKEFPLIWAKTYGKGRVYFNNLGHREETWDRKDVQTMYLEGIKWAMGLTNADVTPGSASTTH